MVSHWRPLLPDPKCLDAYILSRCRDRSTSCPRVHRNSQFLRVKWLQNSRVCWQWFPCRLPSCFACKDLPRLLCDRFPMVLIWSLCNALLALFVLVNGILHSAVVCFCVPSVRRHVSSWISSVFEILHTVSDLLQPLAKRKDRPIRLSSFSYLKACRADRSWTLILRLFVALELETQHCVHVRHPLRKRTGGSLSYRAC